MSNLTTYLTTLRQTLTSHDYKSAQSTLSKAKLALLSSNALVPSQSTPPQLLSQAREILELGALISIRQQDPDSFTRYYAQLQPFYDLEFASNTKTSTSQRSKITGLYLLLLLSQGDYAGFHTVLQGLVDADPAGGKGVEEDVFIRYPVELERSLMEGSYDKVWRETKGERVPSEEFGLFSGVLIHTIRAEIASCSERAYPSLPITNAKNLLYLDSEGAVVEFARNRGWILRDGRIYFPAQTSGEEGVEDGEAGAGGEKIVIENTLGYARELETIV